MKATGGNEVSGGEILQYSMIVFLISRFVMTWAMQYLYPAKLLMVMSLVAMALCIFMTQSPNLAGVIALVSISACLSLMFRLFASCLWGDMVISTCALKSTVLNLRTILMQVH